MAVDADDYSVNIDFTTGQVTVDDHTGLPSFPLPILGDAIAAARAGTAAWNAWINAQPFTSSVKTWHTSTLDSARREGMRLAMSRMNVPQP
jgi:hypothetical protein